MLDTRGNSGKNTAYLAALALIVLVAAGFLLKNYVFTGSEEIAGGQAVSDTGAVRKLENKELDLSFFSDERFRSLNDYGVKPANLDLIKTGKPNPFAGGADLSE